MLVKIALVAEVSAYKVIPAGRLCTLVKSSQCNLLPCNLVYHIILLWSSKVKLIKSIMEIRL